MLAKSVSVKPTLDARTKLITCVVMTLFMFTFHYYSQYFLTIALTALVLALFFAKHERQLVFSHWRLLLFVPTINLLANLLFVNGKVLYSWYFLSLTDMDIKIFIRITLLLVYAFCLIVKTTPQGLALAVGKICHSVTLHRYNGAAIPLTMIIMVSFINRFKDTIIEVQASYKLRANNQGKQTWFKRLLDYTKLLQPIILISMKNANQVANALLAKGYHKGARTFNYAKINYQRRDYLAYLVLLSFMLLNWWLFQ